MTKSELVNNIQAKKSYLCIGLDPDLSKMPQGLNADPSSVLEFNKRIIDATHDLCVAYKPNTAFYEALGPAGWEVLAKTAEYLPKDTFNIADAKRGDIGNTATQYANAFFDMLGFDAMTVNPLMGQDSVVPFTAKPGKWAVVLALTSNEGAIDFLQQRMSGWRLYQRIIMSAQRWGTPNNMMFVVGATQPTEVLEEIRHLAPDHFFLVPGVGAQGGDLAEVSKSMMNHEVGILVNASRSVLFAEEGKDFAKSARKAAKELQQQMEGHLQLIPQL